MPKLSHLSKLGNLHLHDCWQLVAIPELPIGLRSLDASRCKNLKTMPKLFHIF
ncbi:hypothetical protein AMTRI_Chr10g226960 [Amborella trichopoda]